MTSFLPIDLEEQLILVLAIYILEQLGDKKPGKTKVLRFIKARGLTKFCDGDSAIRSNGEEKWMNDFAWAREDAKERGLVRRVREIGIWEISDAGRTWLLERAKSWVGIYEKDPPSKARFLARCRRVNDVAFTHMILIGRGVDVTKKPAALV